MKTDAQLQVEVLDELRHDGRVEATDVGVEVDGAIVTLTGTVDCASKRLAAAEAAHRVGGVLDVANDITVHAPGTGARTDTEIAQEVRRALETRTHAPYRRMRTTVSAGRVTLEGTVEHVQHSLEAEQAARRVAGVVDVVNAIDVIPSRQVTPDDVRAAIDEALVQQAHDEADAIAVEVADGVVTLSGVVRCHRDTLAALGAARHTPGVRVVINQLFVAPEE